MGAKKRSAFHVQIQFQALRIDQVPGGVKFADLKFAAGPGGGIEFAHPIHNTMSNTSATPASATGTSIYSRKNPFLAELTRHELLTGPGSEKETRHFVLNLAGSGLTYAPGDSLGAFG